MVKRLQSLVYGAGMLASSFLFSPEARAEPKIIHYEKTPIELRDNVGVVKKDKVRTIGKVDDDKDRFYFEFSANDYDKRDWTKQEMLCPLHVRHTPLAVPYMGMVVLHPADVQIKNTRQESYLVNNKSQNWEKLVPFEESTKSQVSMYLGEKLLERLVEKVPGGSKAYDKLVAHMIKQNKDYYENVFNVKKDSVATIIPFYVSDRVVGFTETARRIEIDFDMSNHDGKGNFSFWINPAFGNPSENFSQGTFSIGFARIDGIAVDFGLEGKVEDGITGKNTSIEKYFLQKNELGLFRLTGREDLGLLWGRKVPEEFINPAVRNEVEVAGLRKEMKEDGIPGAEGIVGGGCAEYYIDEKDKRGRNPELNIGMFSFDSRKYLMDMAISNLGKEAIILNKGNDLIFIHEDNLEKREHRLSFIKTMLDYQKRTGVSWFNGKEFSYDGFKKGLEFMLRFDSLDDKRLMSFLVDSLMTEEKGEKFYKSLMPLENGTFYSLSDARNRFSSGINFVLRNVEVDSNGRPFYLENGKKVYVD